MKLGASLTPYVNHERLRGAGVEAAVEHATVVVQLHGHRRRAVRVDGRRVGQRAVGRDGRRSREERGVVIGDDEVQQLAVLVGRSGTGVGRPARHGARTGVFEHGLVGALGEGRRVVHEVERDGERLRRAGVHAAVRHTAVVAERHADVGHANGVRRRVVGEGAVRRNRGLRREQRRGVGVDVERQRLRGFVCRTRADPGGPARDGLRAGVFEQRLVGALGEGGGVVDRRHRDGEHLRRARVGAAVGDAAVVAHRHRDVRRPVRVGRRRVSERSVRRNRGLRGEQGRVVGRGGEGQRLAGFVGRSGNEAGRPGRDHLRAAIFIGGLRRACREAWRVVDRVTVP